MKALKLFFLISGTLAVQATALTYDCTITYEITTNEGTSSEVVSKKSFDPKKGLEFEMEVPKPDGLVWGTIRSREGKYFLKMGDFCGEHYLYTEISTPTGEPIHSIYSYGRNPETDDHWRRLHLDCVQAK